MQLDSYYGDNSLHKYPYNGEPPCSEHVLTLKTGCRLLSVHSDGTSNLCLTHVQLFIINNGICERLAQVHHFLVPIIVRIIEYFSSS